MPIIYLKNMSGDIHATVLKETKIHTINNEQFIKLKNSDKKESEIVVNLNKTPNSNGWELFSDSGIYFKFE